MAHLPYYRERTPSPGLPELESAQEGSSRRKVLKTIGGVGVGLAFTDTLVGEMWWAGTNPEFRTLENPEARRAFPHTYTLAIGGFGIADVRSVAEAAGKTLGQYSQMGYLHNSNDGFDIKDTIRQAREFIVTHEVEHLRLYGHSMGGMVATELAAELKDEVAIEALFLDCSPASHHDVRDNERFGTFLLSTLDKAKLHFGPGARFLMEAARPVLDGDSDYLDICRRALARSRADGNCSNRFLQDQASYLRAFDVSSFHQDIPEEIPIFHLHPDVHSHDGTVNNETAPKRWREGLGREVIDVPVIGGTHASVRTHPEIYADTLQATIKRHRLFTSQQR